MAASWQKIEAIFHEALTVPNSRRRGFLEEACGGDLDLLREVESLLEHNRERTTRLEAAVKPIAIEFFASAMNGALEVGSMLGPYQIERKLGEGGMGTVYKATDTRLARDVAVKVISRDLARTTEVRARFRREAQSAAALYHTNIAILHDFCETDESPWLVMEYVKGASLRSRLIGPLGQGAWLHYATQITAALEHAHSRRIIHRDIKPENILITEQDHIKVIDFGLARAIHEQTIEASAITQPNAFIGTLAYAAPELFSGGSASTRSDVYSLGVVFYEMACGAQPFAKLSGHPLVSAILGGSYPGSRAMNPALSPEIATLIDRCMLREPAARFKDAGEVAAALKQVGSGERPLRADTAPPMLAVVDFTNIGGGSDMDWLGTGIAETLTADLGKLKSVRVASRGRVVQSVRRTGNPQNDSNAAVELGREVGARWIVTGSYQRIGNRIRVIPMLIDAGTGDVQPTDKIDGQWTDLFDVQDRVVAELLNRLTIGFGTTDQQKILPAETRSMMAYEHYVRGRKQMYEMHEKSLSTAIHHFGQAVALDPDYAVAYSALGTSHALQFIQDSNPEHIIQASGYLERAIELDPELGEPYPWLAHIRVRRNDLVGAHAAGKKGVELQPDLAEAHYFYAGANYLFPEFHPGAVRETPLALLESIRLQPRFHAAWLGLGNAAAFVGKHTYAIRVLTEALRMESEPDLYFRFTGPRTVLGIVHMRSGAWDIARQYHLEAIDSLRTTNHIYTTCFQALSACGLGDIELRCGNPVAALAHYRHARRIIKEAPRIVGAQRLLIRTNAGLAAAYFSTGESSRARELVGEAIAQLEIASAQSMTVTIECSVPQLNLSLAATQIHMGNIDSAVKFLVRARETGWLDLPWLLIDPELEPLRNHPEFRSFVEELQSAECPDFPLPPGLSFSSSSTIA